MKNRYSLWGGCLIVFFLLASAGCQAGSSATETIEAPPFIPPSSDPAQSQISQAEPTPLPTRQSNCVNQLKFVDDLTIPDGTEVLPGEQITKRWLVRNDGSCNWTQVYTLQLISGLALGAEKIQGLYPARQSSEVVVEIVFRAPDNPGRYNSWWQAYDPDGGRFGDPIYIEIAVVEETIEDEPAEIETDPEDSSEET
jgi:hypothetical protein